MSALWNAPFMNEKKNVLFVWEYSRTSFLFLFFNGRRLMPSSVIWCLMYKTYIVFTFTNSRQRWNNFGIVFLLNCYYIKQFKFDIEHRSRTPHWILIMTMKMIAQECVYAGYGISYLQYAVSLTMQLFYLLHYDKNSKFLKCKKQYFGFGFVFIQS